MNVSPSVIATGFNTVKVIAALLLFYTSFTGIFEDTVGPLIHIEKIIKTDHEFLESCLTSAMGHFAAVSAVKGTLAVVNDSTVFGLALGKIISPISDTVHVVWKALGISMLSITGQMALLKFFQVVGIKLFLTGGALLYVVSMGIIDIIKRTSIALMIMGMVFYIVMPYSVSFSKVMFEESMQLADKELTCSLTAFKSSVDDVEIFSIKNLRPSHAKATMTAVGKSLSDGLDVVIDSLVKYLICILIMFAITPVFFYWIIYLMLRKILDCIGIPTVRVKFDKHILRVFKR